MKLRLRLLTTMVALSMAAPLLSAPAWAAGALAVGKCGVDGYSYSNANRDEAEENAMIQCGPGCRVVLTFERACGAFATDVNRSCGAEGWGRGSDRGEAEEIAVRECINQGGEQCAVKRWVCDGG